MDTHVTELKTEPTGMKAVLLYANRTLETLWLPRRPEGRFRFVLSATGAEFPSFYIEGVNGRGLPAAALRAPLPTAGIRISTALYLGIARS